jgi:uncharacterized protein (UPF0332 family)
MNKYIEEAKKFYEKAVEEFEKGKKEGDMVKIRDASEKAWNAIVQATNALFEKRGMKIPRSHAERRNGLDELAIKDPKVKEKGLRDRYMARDKSLHEHCFYEGHCPLPLLEEDIQKVKMYIEDIEEL